MKKLGLIFAILLGLVSFTRAQYKFDLIKTLPTYGGAPSYFAVVGSKMIFQAGDATTGSELWVTDGSASGTQLLKDINPGANSSSPEGMVVFNGKAYFCADDGTNGR